MSTPTAAHETPGGGHQDRLSAGPRWLLALGLLAALMAVSVALRTTAMGTSYWIDEGIAVGIARFPLSEIPGTLLLDGSPPLYYLLLHLWETWFGTSELATRSLSLLAAVATVPAAWVLARRIAGARAGWVAAILAAGHPFLTYYAQETRMYSLVSLEALLFSGALVLVFAQRRRRWMALAIPAGAAMLYTHNWGLFAVAGSLIACLAFVLAGPRELRRSSIVDGVITYGVIGLLYLPWMPSLLKQASSTGAPWSRQPSVWDLISAFAEPFGYEISGAVLAIITALLAWRIATRKREGDGPSARAAVLLVGMVLATTVIAWCVSQLSPAWSLRYLAVAVGPVILLSGLVLARVPTVAAAMLCFLIVTWARPMDERIAKKSNVAQVSALVQQFGGGDAGDLVISPHPEQIAVISHYLGAAPRYATSLGPQPDPRIFDWRHALERLERAQAADVWAQMRPTMRPGQDVILFVPLLRSANWEAPWTWLARKRAIDWQAVLDADPSLERLVEVPRYGRRKVPRGLRAIVYRVQ